MQDIRKDLKNSKGDYALSVCKSMIGFVPYVGSVASELLGLVISEPVNKRRDEWIIKLYEDLQNLESSIENFKIENLKDDENFITVVLNATQLAIKNHNKEKILALKNACLNTALKLNTDEEKQLIFLNYVNELVPLDLRLLRYFKNPHTMHEKLGKDPYSMYYSGSPLKGFFECHKDINLDENLVKMRLDGLISKGLLVEFSYQATCSTDGMLSSRVSDIGNEFVDFITR